MRWFKLWTDILGDPKIMRAPVATRWAWIGILSLASDRNDNGKVELAAGIAFEDEDIAATIGITSEQWVTAKAYFLKLDMLRKEGDAYTIRNYVKRQASPDPTAAERKRRQRESVAVAQGLAAGVPLAHASGEMADAWREAVGVEPTPGLLRSMAAAEKQYGLEQVLEAIEITGEAGKATWGYAAGVLKNKANGIGKPNGHAEEDEYSMENDPLLKGIDWGQFTREVTWEESARKMYGDAAVDALLAKNEAERVN